MGFTQNYDFLCYERGAEPIQKKKKKNTNTRKTLKYEAKEKRRIQGKINNNNEHLWFYILYK